MRKFILLMAVLLLALPASAETLNFQVTDTLSVDAEAPDAPAALPTIWVKYHEFDVDELQKRFMKTDTRRTEGVDDEGRYFQLGDAEGGGEYMLIELDLGRFCYTSEYDQKYLQELMDFDDEMTDNSNLFPDDLELSWMSRAEAIERTRRMLQELGIRLMHGERVYTLEKDSYVWVQGQLAQSERQVDMPKRYLDPFDPAHEGYFMVFEQELNGLSCDALGNRFPVRVLLTRQGYEYVESGYNVVEVSWDEEKPLLSAGDALKAAAVGLQHTFKPALKEDGTLDRLPVAIERIRLVYEPDNTGKEEAPSTACVPVWKYAYPSGMLKDAGTWRERALDNAAFIRTIHVDARTGALLAESYPS